MSSESSDIFDGNIPVPGQDNTSSSDGFDFQPVNELPNSLLSMDCIPELSFAPVLELSDDNDRPILPMHKQEELPPGTKVYLCHLDDLITLTNGNYLDQVVPYTSGNKVGTVIRHSHTLTLVQFETPEKQLIEQFSLPRAFLSLEKIHPRPVEIPPRKIKANRFGDINPKAGRQFIKPSGDIDNTILTLFDLYILNYSSFEAFPEISGSLQKYKSGDYEECLELLNNIHTQCDQSNFSEHHTSNECAQPKSSDYTAIPNLLSAVLLWRSSVLLKLNRVEDAIKDSLMCVEKAPNCSLCYIRLTEVFACFGKKLSSMEALRWVEKIMPNEHLNLIQSIYCHIWKTDSALRENGMSLYIDSRAIRRIKSLKYIIKGQTILSEKPIAWVPTYQNEVNMCVQCGKYIESGQGVPPDTPKIHTNWSCSTECHIFANTHFRDYESKHALKSVFAINFILQDRLNNVKNPSYIDYAYLTIRIFHIIVAKAFNDNPGTLLYSEHILPILLELGLLPVPAIYLDAKVARDLTVLWEVLTMEFTTALKEVFDYRLLRGIFLCVESYSIRYDTYCDQQGTKSQQLFYPTIRTNKTHKLEESADNTWNWIATQDIPLDFLF